MVPGTQQGGHSEDNRNEVHVTDENNRNNPNDEGGDTSMNNNINPSDKGNYMNLREMMKGIINSVSNPRVQALSQHAPDLKLATVLLSVLCPRGVSEYQQDSFGSCNGCK